MRKRSAEVLDIAIEFLDRSPVRGAAQRTAGSTRGSA